MNDAAFALVFYVVYLGAAFGLRTVLQLRATGNSGMRGISGRPGSAEWLGGILFVVALLLGILAPVLQLAGLVVPIEPLDTAALGALGAALAVTGTALTLVAQSAMGTSWRIGVAYAEETTALVTDGPFAVVRNPVFAAMIPTAIGLALMAPNVVAAAAVLSLFVALELQTRVVEEPYLLSTHGDRYASYAARVGRFAPGLGRLKDDGHGDRVPVAPS